MSTIGQKMKAIADAIRAKTNGTSKLTLDGMKDAITSYTSDADATSDSILLGKVAYAKDKRITGNIETRSESSISVTGGSIIVPAGYYATETTKTFGSSVQGETNIEISSSGLITATVTQQEGYVDGGTISITKQMDTMAEETIIPSVSDRIISSGKYLIGDVLVKGDESLIPENIRSGSTIFNIDGTYEGVELNFEVVGGTTKPLVQTNNLIWVNTSTDITSYVFSYSEPEGDTGKVWFKTAGYSKIAINALKDNSMMLYIVSAKQYIAESWSEVDIMVYIDSSWVEPSLYLFREGDHCTDATGGWKQKPATASWSAIDPSSSTISVSAGKEQDYDISAYAQTVNLIDVTDYDLLSVQLDEINKTFTLSLIDANDSSVASTTATAAGTVVLNTSGINGSYYVSFKSVGVEHGGYASTNFIVSEVVLS